jgi:hypothetical protein
MQQAASPDFLPLIVYFWIGGILRACNDAVPIPCFALMITRLSELRSAWCEIDVCSPPSMCAWPSAVSGAQDAASNLHHSQQPTAAQRWSPPSTRSCRTRTHTWCRLSSTPTLWCWPRGWASSFPQASLPRAITSPTAPIPQVQVASHTSFSRKTAIDLLNRTR